MSILPRSSPWGRVQHCEVMREGVFDVSTAGHGGIMVRKNAADFLSPEARKSAINERNYLCYEEDCDASIVIREMLDKGLWQIPDRVTDKARYEDSINRSLQQWNPEYWEARQKSPRAQTNREKSAGRVRPQEENKPTLAERLEAGKAKAAAHIAERPQNDAPRKAKGGTEIF